MNQQTAKLNTHKKGFTLVEVLICVVIIVFISIAALSATLATADIVQRADDRNRAISQVEMIMACKRTDDFPAAMKLCGIDGVTAGNFIVYYDADYKPLGLKAPAGNDYHVRIEVTVGDNSVGLVAIHRESGNTLYKTEEWLG